MNRRSYLSTPYVVPALFLVAASGGLFYFWPVLRQYQSTENFFILSCAVILAVFVALHVGLRARQRLFRQVGDASIPDSQQLYEELFMNSPMPYLLVNRRGIIVAPNIAAVRMFGMPDSELRKKNLFKLLDSENNTHLSLIPQKLEKGIYVNDEEVKVVRPDETFRWAALSGFPVEGAGRKKFNLVTLIDITKQKQIDQVKTEFVSLASHQLRTPISSLKWNAELLLSERAGELTEKQLKYVQKVERAAERMDGLVGDFLNVSKLELGTLVPRAKQVDLDEFLSSIYEEFTERIESKNLTFTTEYDEEITSLVVDKRLLRMVLSNLISNAVKYTPNDGTVTVRYGGNKRRITFWVTDTGMGIPKEDQEMLFTKLFRAKNAREQVPNGTGLGLYVVKQAVEVMKGTITFSSKVNEGTTFEVVLPR